MWVEKGVSGLTGNSGAPVQPLRVPLRAYWCHDRLMTMNSSICGHELGGWATARQGSRPSVGLAARISRRGTDRPQCTNGGTVSSAGLRLPK
jgi:hypothetical protein